MRVTSGQLQGRRDRRADANSQHINHKIQQYSEKALCISAADQTIRNSTEALSKTTQGKSAELPQIGRFYRHF